MKLSLQLPWPNMGLSSNARVHWRKHASLVRAHRGDAEMFTKAALGRTIIKADAACIVSLLCTFLPPDARRRDRSNMIGMMKAYEDGIADALRIDDSRFVWRYDVGSPVKGGRVDIEVTV